MSDPIVVPLDGSLLAERALAPAKTLARYTQAELHLVRVAPLEPAYALVDPSYGVIYPDQALATAWKDTNRYLTAVHKACLAEDLSAQADVREGDVASEVVEAAWQAHARLIVMSSHGYSGVNRWLLGSVAEKVLHAAPCPVWVVRTPSPLRHMLVTLDGSALAEEVLTPALEVARCFNVPVTLLRVVPELRGSDAARLEASEAGLSRRYADELVLDAADYLERLAERYATDGLTIETAVRTGAAATTILDYAERHEIDLVAITTHGRTGLRRWVYGSVMQKVLDQLPVSLLVVRSHTADQA
jgi:nucleotide-binding universal stress UspA family protein